MISQRPFYAAARVVLGWAVPIAMACSTGGCLAVATMSTKEYSDKAASYARQARMIAAVCGINKVANDAAEQADKAAKAAKEAADIAEALVAAADVINANMDALVTVEQAIAAADKSVSDIVHGTAVRVAHQRQRVRELGGDTVLTSGLTGTGAGTASAGVAVAAAAAVGAPVLGPIVGVAALPSIVIRLEQLEEAQKYLGALSQQGAGEVLGAADTLGTSLAEIRRVANMLALTQEQRAEVARLLSNAEQELSNARNFASQALSRRDLTEEEIFLEFKKAQQHLVNALASIKAAGKIATDKLRGGVSRADNAVPPEVMERIRQRIRDLGGNVNDPAMLLQEIGTEIHNLEALAKQKHDEARDALIRVQQACPQAADAIRGQEHEEDADYLGRPGRPGYVLPS